MADISKNVDNASPAPYNSEAAWLGFFLQSNDTFYPTGSYAHSYGLEGLAQAGLVNDRASLREFVLASALPALQRNDLPLAAHAWRALAAEDWSRVEEISTLAASLKTSKEARTCSENIGRQRAELCASLHSSELAREYVRRMQASRWAPHATISAALEARVFGAPIEATLVSIYYSSIAGLLAAAMKLLRIGQNGAQTLLAETMAESTTIIAAAQAVPFDEIGWFNPWLDIAAARHETADARLFIS